MNAMTLEQVRDEILPHVDGIGPYAEVRVVDMQDWADAIADHLTQPAQSVDVEDVRLLLELVEDEHGGDHFEADCRYCAAFDRLTAALQEKGNG